MKRIKRIKSHIGYSRFLVDCCEDDGRYIDRQPNIPSPYSFSSEWEVYRYEGKDVIVRETSHKVYDVFLVPDDVQIKQREAEQ